MVKLSCVKFVVITDIKDYRSTLCDYCEYIIAVGRETVRAVGLDDIDAPRAIKPVSWVKAPAFKLGEILICDVDGSRLISIPDMRKPYKWGTDNKTYNSITENKLEFKGIIFEIFDKVDDAIKRAREVTGQD